VSVAHVRMGMPVIDGRWLMLDSEFIVIDIL